MFLLILKFTVILTIERLFRWLWCQSTGMFARWKTGEIATIFTYSSTPYYLNGTGGYLVEAALLCNQVDTRVPRHFSRDFLCCPMMVGTIPHHYNPISLYYLGIIDCLRNKPFNGNIWKINGYLLSPFSCLYSGCTQKCNTSSKHIGLT